MEDLTVDMVEFPDVLMLGSAAESLKTPRVTDLRFYTLKVLEDVSNHNLSHADIVSFVHDLSWRRCTATSGNRLFWIANQSSKYSRKFSLAASLIMDFGQRAGQCLTSTQRQTNFPLKRYSDSSQKTQTCWKAGVLSLLIPLSCSGFAPQQALINQRRSTTTFPSISIAAR